MPRTANRLFRRPRSQFWQASWEDAAGIVHKQSTGCTDRKQAQTWLATREMERVREQAGIPTARRLALADAAAEYLAEHIPPIWAKGWYAAVEGFFRLQVYPHFGEAAVSEITEADAAKFRALQLQRKVRGGKTVSPSTVNRVFWALAAWGDWCIERRYALANPWKLSSLPETQTPPPTVDAGTLRRVLLALDARWRPVVAFASETGMRRGELGRLRWEDIAGDVAWVVSSNTRGLTKARRTRPVPLTDRALEVLRTTPRRRDGLVFGPIGNARRAFQRAAEAAGLGRVWLHLFRHAAASRAAEAGASVAEVQLLGGWSSSRIAERYVHARLDRLREALNRQAADEGNVEGTLPPEGGAREND